MKTRHDVEGAGHQAAEGGTKGESPFDVEGVLSDCPHSRIAKKAHGQRDVTEYWFCQDAILVWDAEFDVQ